MKKVTVSITTESLEPALRTLDLLADMFSSEESLELSISNVNESNDKVVVVTPDAAKAPEGQDDTPHHLEELGGGPTEQRSHEVNPGDNPVWTASAANIEAYFKVCSEQAEGVFLVAPEETLETIMEVNADFDIDSDEINKINNVDYYRALTDDLHALELRQKGYKNDDVNQRLKTEYPKVARDLGM